MAKTYAKTYPKTYPKTYGKTSPPVSVNPILELNPSGYFDISEMSSLYQDSAKTTPVTASGQSVGAIEDLSGTQPDFLAIANNNRGTYTESGNEKFIDFDGVDDFYKSSTTSGYKFMHTGTGGEFIGMFAFGDSSDPDDRYAMVDNFSSSSSKIGFGCAYEDRVSSGSNNALTYAVGRGVGGQYVSTQVIANKITPEAATIVDIYYYNPDISDFKAFIDGVSIGTSTQAYTPSSSNSTNNMVLGQQVNNIRQLLGQFYMMVFFPRQLTSDERTIVTNYMLSKL